MKPQFIKKVNNFSTMVSQAWVTFFIYFFATLFISIFLSFQTGITKTGIVGIVISFIPFISSLLYIFNQPNKFFKLLTLKFKTIYFLELICILPIIVGIVLFSYSLISNIRIDTMLLRAKIISSMEIYTSIKMLFIIVIISPFLEEIIFRGIVLQGFLTKYSQTKAIIFSSILFSLFHLNPFQFLIAFFLGIIIGWYFTLNKNLLLSIIIHSSSNLVGVIFLKYFLDKSSSIKYDISKSLFINNYLLFYHILSIILIGLGFLALMCTIKKIKVLNEVKYN